MNKSKIRLDAKALAQIILGLARHGYEVELVTNRSCRVLVLGHKKSIPSEVLISLRKSRFECSYLDVSPYYDADGNRRHRSYFRGPL
jgi:hypothetical protein